MVEAKVENVVSTEHCVILADIENGAKRKIALVEHFMAACAIREIDALDVYFNSQGFEMPIFVFAVYQLSIFQDQLYLDLSKEKHLFYDF